MERTGIGIGSLHFWNVGFSTFASAWWTIHPVGMHESNFCRRLQDSMFPWLRWGNRGVFHNLPVKSTDGHGDGTNGYMLFCLAFVTYSKYYRILEFAFCFCSFCLECCERLQCLIAPTQLNITRLCGLGTYSFQSSFSNHSTNRSSSTTSLCTVP